MRRKRTMELAAISIFILLFGPLRSGAQGEAPLKVAKAVKAAGGYQAKVAAVQKQFAAVRTSLGLSNTAGIGFTPESDLGQPDCHNVGGGGSGGGGSSSKTATASSAQHSVCTASSKGAPVWMVNMVNLNFYMADTPLWYSTPIGPSVELKLSYNSQIGQDGALGSKWQLNYGTYLYPETGTSTIIVIMPDGKNDYYLYNGAGVYSHPYHTFNTLTKIAGNRFELKFPDGTIFVYDIPPGTASSVSLLVEIRDPYGQKLAMGYDANARLTKVTDALGKVTTLTYNGYGLMTLVTDPFGRFASFEYDANRNLTKITDMGGYWTGFSYRQYTANDYYLSAMTNAAGNWGFYFEPNDIGSADPYPAPGAAMGNNYRITVTDPGGGREEVYRSSTSGSAWHVSQKNYIPYSDASNNNSAGSVPKTLYGYVSNSNSMGEVGSIASPEGFTRGFVYDDAGNITSTSEGSSSYTYTYNSMGSVTSVTDPKNTVTNATYAANGVDLTGVVDGLGNVALTYNGTHDITSFTDRLGNKYSISYNAYGQTTSTIDPLGITTNYVYDVNHLLSQVTRSGQTLKSFSYDAMGRIKSYTDATGLTRTYDYNSLDDITKITYPDGRHMSAAYSADIPHLITGITDRSGKTTQFTYDAAKNLIHAVNPEGGILAFDYDANGNMAYLIDPNGNKTGLGYDNDNRLVKKSFADGTSASFDYDKKTNNISHYYNARNDYTGYRYDANDNLSEIYHNFNTVFEMTPDVSYQHDPNNRLTGMTDLESDYAYGYDAESRLTSIDGPYDNDTLTFTYDNKGRRTGYALEGGQTVTYAYDTLGRLTSIHSGAGTYTYTYSGASPFVQKLTRPNGSYTEYQYDNLNRLTMLSNKTSGGSIINQYAYAYNAQDLRSSETITNGTPITSFTSGSTTYSYNNVNQLVSSANPDKTFIYDVDGNLTQWQTPDGSSLTGYYDVENRLALIQYADYSGQRTFSYNGNGFMTKKVADWTDETRYVLNGALPFQERDGNNNATREYTWGLNYGGGIGGLLSLNQGGQNYYYLYDGKGNVTALIDSAQSVVATYAYDPFGKPMTKTGTLDQPYRFSTKPYDEKTGLSYYGYRFYSPSIGRWMARDPIEEEGGLNMYAFAHKDPIQNLDLFGLDDGSSVTPQSIFESLRGAFDIFTNIKKGAQLVVEGGEAAYDFVKDKLFKKARDESCLTGSATQDYKNALRVTEITTPAVTKKGDAVRRTWRRSASALAGDEDTDSDSSESTDPPPTRGKRAIPMYPNTNP